MTKENTFYFIDGLQADRASKKLMRRHVMQGKNVGKKFHRPSRVAAEKVRRQVVAEGPDRDSLRAPRHDPEERHAYWMRLSAETAMRSAEHVLLPFSLPVEVTPRLLGVMNQFFGHVVDRIYPAYLRVSPHQMKLMSMRVLSLDADAFNCTIYLMQASNELFLGDGDSSPNALYHISQTLAAVNRRLHSNEALSDSTVAIVISLVHQEQMRNRQTDALVHFKGLARIVELRGGLDGLRAEGDPYLPAKLCKTDVMFALQYGGPTLFFQDRMLDVQTQLATQQIHFDANSAATTCSPQTSLDPDLEGALRGAMAAATLFNNDLRNSTLDCLAFIDIVVSLFYRLLRFSTLNGPVPASAVHGAYHIGLIVFTMTILAQRGRRQIIKCGLIAQRLRAVLESDLGECDDELVFWVTIVGAIWVADNSDGAWFALRVQICAQNLGIDSWERARSSLCKFPWINSLHDEPGSALWDRVHPGASDAIDGGIVSFLNIAQAHHDICN